MSQGLRTGPKRRGSDTGRIPNSGMLVLPTITAGIPQPPNEEGIVPRDEAGEVRSIAYGIPATGMVPDRKGTPGERP